MSKGGTQTTSQTIPDWLEAPARRNLARAEEISQIGYVPYKGPDVAALTGQQMDAMRNTNSMARTYGLETDPIDQAKRKSYAGGIEAYSSFPAYNQARRELKETRPGQFKAINAQFINPYTGAGPRSVPAAVQTQKPDLGIGWVPPKEGDGSGGSGVGDPGGGYGGSYSGGNGSGAGGGTSGAPAGGVGGYSGIGDMFDGGGPGASGSTYSGGGAISGIGNALGGPGAFGNDSDEGGGGGGGGAK